MSDPTASTPAPASAALADKYTVENAERYAWGSVSGELDPARVALLRESVVGPRVLDAGCGGGAFVDWLARSGFDATGLDYFPQFLEIARGRGYGGRFVQGDVTAMPLPDASFETAVCFDVLEHVDDAAAIRELARVATRRLIVAVPRRDDELSGFPLTFRQYQDQTHLRYYTEESLTALCATVAPSPGAVRVLPEVPIPADELVRFFLTPDSHAARADLEGALLAEAPPLPEVADVLDLESVLREPPSAPESKAPAFSLRGVRDRLRDAVVASPLLRRAVLESHRSALAGAAARAYREAHAQAYRQHVAAAFDARFNPFIVSLLANARYRTVYTGLVAVVDLAQTPEQTA